MSERRGAGILDFRPSMRQTMTITEKADETGGEISRVEIEMEGSQSGPPKHLHPGQREIYTVLDGELTVTLGAERQVVRAGESIEIPAGVVHGFDNPSGAPVRFQADHLPALRFEEYIRLVHGTVSGRKATLRVILRIVRIESSFSDLILPPPGPPRIAARVLAGIAKLAGYPTGDELAPSK